MDYGPEPMTWWMVAWCGLWLLVFGGAVIDDWMFPKGHNRWG